MLKLTKYEFRKNLTNLIIVFLILAAAQIYFTFSCILKNTEHASIAVVLLVLFTSISFFIVVAFGISTYNKELNSNASYLIFMTPNSSLKIILSKMLYTFIFGCVLALILVFLSYVDVKMLTNLEGSPLDYLELIKVMMTNMGIDYMSVVFGIITGLVSIIVTIFLIIALSYFAITLTSTMLQNKKFKNFISLVVFVVIGWLTATIDNKLPYIYDNPQTTAQAIITILPSILFCLIVGAVCVWISAVLLDKKVSL